MGRESIIVRCPACGAKNRVPAGRWGERATCGQCKSPLRLQGLFPDSPIDVVDGTFREEVAAFPGPVLVDFTAPW